MEEAKLEPLPREFYLRGANTVAPELLGKRLVHRTPEGLVGGVIVEVEAYVGDSDKAAHSYPHKRTRRTQIQFGAGGYAYVYAIYGMHTCFNIVVNAPDVPEAVLVRALAPTDGLAQMELRRQTQLRTALCSGPAKLCQALAITQAHYGVDLCGSELFLTPYWDVPKETIRVSPRINVDYAGECADLPWRYYIAGSAFVSPVAGKYTRRAQKYQP